MSPSNKILHKKCYFRAKVSRQNINLDLSRGSNDSVDAAGAGASQGRCATWRRWHAGRAIRGWVQTYYGATCFSNDDAPSALTWSAIFDITDYSHVFAGAQHFTLDAHGNPGPFLLCIHVSACVSLSASASLGCPCLYFCLCLCLCISLCICIYICVCASVSAPVSVFASFDIAYLLVLLLVCGCGFDVCCRCRYRCGCGCVCVSASVSASASASVSISVAPVCRCLSPCLFCVWVLVCCMLFCVFPSWNPKRHVATGKDHSKDDEQAHRRRRRRPRQTEVPCLFRKTIHRNYGLWIWSMCGGGEGVGVCVHVCVCVSMCVYICIYYIHMRIHIYLYIKMYSVYVYVHTCMQSLCRCLWLSYVYVNVNESAHYLRA